MKTSRTYLLQCTLPFLLVGCVSKTKYLQLESLQTKTLAQVTHLRELEAKRSQELRMCKKSNSYKILERLISALNFFTERKDSLTSSMLQFQEKNKDDIELTQSLRSDINSLKSKCEALTPTQYRVYGRIKSWSNDDKSPIIVGDALSLDKGDFEVGVRAYDRGQDIAQRAEKGLLAPFEGLVESALKARALQESGGDLVKATERMREIRRQGVPELYKTVASFYGTYRAKAALMFEGFTAAQIDAMKEPPTAAPEAGVVPLGSNAYTMKHDQSVTRTGEMHDNNALIINADIQHIYSNTIFDASGLYFHGKSEVRNEFGKPVSVNVYSYIPPTNEQFTKCSDSLKRLNLKYQKLLEIAAIYKKMEEELISVKNNIRSVESKILSFDPEVNSN